MLLAIRIVTIVSGLATAANVALGFMSNQLFIIPDYVAAAALILAAIIPQPALATRAMLAANALTLGVFTVAITGHYQTVSTHSIGLLIGLGVSLALTIALLLPSRRTAA